MKRKDLIAELERLGYKRLREGSEHTVYRKAGKRQEQVPRHAEVNEETAKAILRRARS